MSATPALLVLVGLVVAAAVVGWLAWRAPLDPWWSDPDDDPRLFDVEGARTRPVHPLSPRVARDSARENDLGTEGDEGVGPTC